MRLVIILGFLAGLASVAGLAFTAPFLAQERVHAETRVQNNGGRFERFEIRLPDDRLNVLPAADSAVELWPSSTNWYADLAPFNQSASVFRVRNENGEVIGTGVRVRGVNRDSDVEWVLHVPARGTLVLQGESAEVAELGDIALGTGEFSELGGTWEARLDADDVWRIDTVVLAAVREDAA